MAEHPGKYALRQLLDEYQGLFPSAAQQVNDYVAELEARLEERDCDMHARIRANYDKTVADCWRAKVAELEALVAEARVFIDEVTKGRWDTADWIGMEQWLERTAPKEGT